MPNLCLAGFAREPDWIELAEVSVQAEATRETGSRVAVTQEVFSTPSQMEDEALKDVRQLWESGDRLLGSSQVTENSSVTNLEVSVNHIVGVVFIIGHCTPLGLMDSAQS